MRKNRFIYIAMAIVVLVFQACSDDEVSTVQFQQVSATYNESDGTATIVVPVQGSTSGVTFQLDGTATEGEDFNIIGFNAEGLQIEVIDDNLFEGNEYVRIMMVGSNVTGNTFFTLNIISNCEDTGGFSLAGDYKVVTDDWADFGSGDVLEVEIIDATHLRVVDYPATGYNHVDMVITITDLITGAATVVSQDNGSYNASGTQQCTTSGSGNVTSCDGIVLTLDFAFPGSNYTDNLFVLEKI